MAAPNIVNVATITGISTFIAGINTGGDGVAVTKNPAGVTTIVSNAASRCLLYTSPSPRDMRRSRMPSSA